MYFNNIILCKSHQFHQFETKKIILQWEFCKFLMNNLDINLRSNPQILFKFNNFYFVLSTITIKKNKINK